MLKIRTSALMLPGHAAWMLRGEAVCMGRIGQPTEGVDFDEFVFHETDAAKLFADIARRCKRMTEDEAWNNAVADFLHIHISAPPCDHEWGGWREFEDGRGGEQFCSKCGMGALEHTLRNDPT
jgi:hypothetical protein